MKEKLFMTCNKDGKELYLRWGASDGRRDPGNGFCNGEKGVVFNAT